VSLTPDNIRKWRKIGFAVIIACWFLLVIPMFIGAFGGYNTEKVWDPYTNKKLQGDDITRCDSDADLLLNEAQYMKKLERRWELQARKWMVKCRRKRPDLYDKVSRTRARLRHPEET